METLLTVAAIWMVCGLAAAGMAFAHFQASYPRLAVEFWREDLGMSLLIGLLFGPVSVVVVFFLTGFAKNGWSLWPPRSSPPLN